MAWNPKYRVEMFEDGKIFGLIILEPYWPIALKTDNGQVIFSGIEGERSDPIPISDGAEEVGIQMLWLSEGAQYLIPAQSEGWVSMRGGFAVDPEPKKGTRRVLGVSQPHSYGGGSKGLWKTRFATVLREKDLPLKRDERGTWTATGDILPGTEEIPYWMDLEVENLEGVGNDRIIQVARIDSPRD